MNTPHNTTTDRDAAALAWLRATLPAASVTALVQGETITLRHKRSTYIITPWRDGWGGWCYTASKNGRSLMPSMPDGTSCRAYRDLPTYLVKAGYPRELVNFAA